MADLQQVRRTFTNVPKYFSFRVFKVFANLTHGPGIKFFCMYSRVRINILIILISSWFCKFLTFFPLAEKVGVHDSKLKISDTEMVRHVKTNSKCYFVLKRVRLRIVVILAEL
jgi:hypothetical protein